MRTCNANDASGLHGKQRGRHAIEGHVVPPRLVAMLPSGVSWVNFLIRPEPGSSETSNSPGAMPSGYVEPMFGMSLCGSSTVTELATSASMRISPHTARDRSRLNHTGKTEVEPATKALPDASRDKALPLQPAENKSVEPSADSSLRNPPISPGTDEPLGNRITGFPVIQARPTVSTGYRFGLPKVPADVFQIGPVNPAELSFST